MSSASSELIFLTRTVSCGLSRRRAGAPPPEGRAVSLISTPALGPAPSSLVTTARLNEPVSSEAFCGTLGARLPPKQPQQPPHFSAVLGWVGLIHSPAQGSGVGPDQSVSGWVIPPTLPQEQADVQTGQSVCRAVLAPGTGRPGNGGILLLDSWGRGGSAYTVDSQTCTHNFYSTLPPIREASLCTEKGRVKIIPGKWS